MLAHGRLKVTHERLVAIVVRVYGGNDQQGRRQDEEPPKHWNNREEQEGHEDGGLQDGRQLLEAPDQRHEYRLERADKAGDVVGRALHLGGDGRVLLGQRLAGSGSGRTLTRHGRDGVYWSDPMPCINHMILASMNILLTVILPCVVARDHCW